MSRDQSGERLAALGGRPRDLIAGHHLVGDQRCDRNRPPDFHGGLHRRDLGVADAEVLEHSRWCVHDRVGIEPLRLGDHLGCVGEPIEVDPGE